MTSIEARITMLEHVLVTFMPASRPDLMPALIHSLQALRDDPDLQWPEGSFLLLDRLQKLEPSAP